MDIIREFIEETREKMQKNSKINRSQNIINLDFHKSPRDHNAGKIRVLNQDKLKKITFSLQLSNI